MNTYYVGDYVRAEYGRGNDLPLHIYYRIIAITQTNDKVIYTLKLTSDGSERELYSSLIDGDSVRYRKVIDGTNNRNGYEG